MVFFNFSLFFLILYLFVQSIVERKMFKSPIIIMGLSIHFFSSIYFCFTCFVVLLFGRYIFRIPINSLLGFDSLL